MRKFFPILAVLIVVSWVGLRLRADYPPDTLVTALIQHESTNRDSPPPGDQKLANWAYGPLQIRQPCVDDVNGLHLDKPHKAAECQGNRPLSIWICREYINMYATKAKLGHTPTVEDMARIWNGGPDGYKRSSTLVYWADVQKLLGKS